MSSQCPDKSFASPFFPDAIRSTSPGKGAQPLYAYFRGLRRDGSKVVLRFTGEANRYLNSTAAIEECVKGSLEESIRMHFMKTKNIVATFMLFLALFARGAFAMQTVLMRYTVGLTFEKLSSAKPCRMRRLLRSKRGTRISVLKTRGHRDIRPLILISWPICGEEYALLEHKDVVRDVLKFPEHSKSSPQFIGSCQLNGHDVLGSTIAVLKDEPGVQMLPAVSAWKIDGKQAKFVKIQIEGLRCSRDGISTADGGR